MHSGAGAGHSGRKAAIVQVRAVLAGVCPEARRKGRTCRNDCVGVSGSNAGLDRLGEMAGGAEEQAMFKRSTRARDVSDIRIPRLAPRRPIALADTGSHERDG